MQLFTPRQARSTWSKLNKQRAVKLQRERRMTAAGREKVEAAKKNGAWTKLDTVENLKTPVDLAKALSAFPTAKKNFRQFSRSSKKGILW